MDNTLRIDPALLKDMSVTGYEDPNTLRIMEVHHLLKQTGYTTLEPLLPLLLNLKGHPFTLRRGMNKAQAYSPGFAPFETFYRTRVARRTLYVTGRQLGKTANLCARGIITHIIKPYLVSLYVCPLFEQTRRLSKNIMEPFLDESPVKSLILPDDVGSVLQRTFFNKSKMIFSYAGLTADRTRGVSGAERLVVDELQGLMSAHLPILRETLSAAPGGGIEEYAGTPKSLANIMYQTHQTTSKAEWAIKCHHCGFWNIPCLTHHLEAMMGPVRDDICYERPGTICARCRQFILPQTGRWIHAHPELRWKFAGYHIPQQIMPMHFADKEKWELLLAKRDGYGNTPRYVFNNEVCGEHSDSGSRMITVTELQQACVLPWHRNLNEALAAADEQHYLHRLLACDWGGGGDAEKSWTVFSVMGMCADGKVDVIFAFKSLDPHNHTKEARLAIGLASHFKCHIIAHDYTGTGSLRETMITSAGWPAERIVPVAYTAAAVQIAPMQFKKAGKNGQRAYYQLDKPRSLLLTCNQIKTGWLRFYQDDYHNDEDPGLIRDFLALVPEKHEIPGGRDRYIIGRDPAFSDDFAQATNIGLCTLYHMSDKWPNLAAIANLRVSEETLAQIQPPDRDVLQDLGR